MGWTTRELGLSGPEVVVTGLSVDDRRVRPGDLFAALPGVNLHHGARFAAKAVERGAAAVLTDRDRGRDRWTSPIPVLVVGGAARGALAFAAAIAAGERSPRRWSP